eukprot:TRINITY_DN5425_c0_g1_i1.p1 TRINITY_DN5425_c0_g1~~TRINITY_DN5425_c0_g1_i1.p1  ORF type:complete len:455 (+),score=127.57 TRINITY_DN5425_c0_g1_i1:84-1367(+)
MAAGWEDDDPASDFDQAYYTALTADLSVRVRRLPGKGKGIVAARDFKAGEVVLREQALAAVQNADEHAHMPLKQAGVRVCCHTLRSLETPRDMWERVAGEGVPCPALPRLSRYRYPHAAHEEGLLEGDAPPGGVKCEGCEARYCSNAARDSAWALHHCVLCPGAMSEPQRAALTEWAEEGWTQGGVDYSDTFALTLQYFAVVAASARANGGDLAAAWRPFSMLIACPWQRFSFGYLLSDPGDTEHGTTKAHFLAKACRLLRVLFPSCEGLITEQRVSNTLGCVLLNSQERTPTSPWDDYVDWLRSGAGSRTGRTAGGAEAQALTAAAEKHAAGLQFSTRGQATYRVGACFNHSCSPNVEVSYCDLQDETLIFAANCNIRAGDELCISYLDETMPLARRQAHLKEHYLFQCVCPRCNAEGKQEEAGTQ